MESNGFNVLYFSYESVVAAFAKYGIDISFDEQTSENDFLSKIKSFEESERKGDIIKCLFEINKENVNKFLAALTLSIERSIEHIFILPLHGKQAIISTVSDAIYFLTNYPENIPCSHPIDHYEIIIKYTTGDKIDATLKAKNDAIIFLKGYL